MVHGNIYLCRHHHKTTKTVIQLHLCINNPPMDRCPACHPFVGFDKHMNRNIAAIGRHDT